MLGWHVTYGVIDEEPRAVAWLAYQVPGEARTVAARTLGTPGSPRFDCMRLCNVDFSIWHTPHGRRMAAAPCGASARSPAQAVRAVQPVQSKAAVDNLTAEGSSSIGQSPGLQNRWLGVRVPPALRARLVRAIQVQFSAAQVRTWRLRHAVRPRSGEVSRDPRRVPAP